jgi:hypothetical protein
MRRRRIRERSLKKLDEQDERPKYVEYGAPMPKWVDGNNSIIVIEDVVDVTKNDYSEMKSAIERATRLKMIRNIKDGRGRRLKEIRVLKSTNNLSDNQKCRLFQLIKLDKKEYPNDYRATKEKKEA